MQHFRSYQAGSVSFDSSPLHVLLGENGAGKTNVLEAISLLSLTKSCQGADEEDMIHWGETYYRIDAEVLSDTGETSRLSVVSQLEPRKAKAYFINDVKLTATILLGYLPTVFFLPEDLDLFMGAPALRRKFLDQLLCQVSAEYAGALSRYQQILRQRSAVLKAIRDGRSSVGDLTLWNEKIAQEGAFVIQERLGLLEVLQLTLLPEMNALGEQWQSAQLESIRKTTERSRGPLEKELFLLLQKNAERDVILQATTVGPHRDDWRLLIDGRPIETFASRGQKRAALLALLSLQVSYLELKKGERPVLLLDDVFSELDTPHQEALLKSLSHHQVFITTTHMPTQFEHVQTFTVTKGKITEDQSATVRA